jgi:N-acetyl-anhydromuramyl-L-alanine amidase AmpD
MANAPYLHLEMIPCVFAEGHELVTAAEPLRAGLRFTKAQHDAVVALACDVAARKGWDDPDDHARWWRTPRLLGHEDLTPLSRHDKSGGWDPGALRPAPYFDWQYVLEAIADRHRVLDQAGLVMAHRDQVRPAGGRYAKL